MNGSGRIKPGGGFRGNPEICLRPICLFDATTLRLLMFAIGQDSFPDPSPFQRATMDGGITNSLVVLSMFALLKPASFQVGGLPAVPAVAGTRMRARNTAVSSNLG